ncbi:MULTISPECIES: hypothetical protein [Nostoc]|uniref:Uncharacterized protein n=1 Tax=Nostoc paludosum FACHB-159 TaxID=2692908 RepID=A0ABR8KJR1_9NOSO|nr:MULTISPECIES: hypothetical protein [Nostoc]MBD2683453.1 hypothetical protein [Nostoc sp. FACHB-857]MBD2739776.1 hypothetical protein [Nostoc paludosum FACHB-159]
MTALLVGLLDLVVVVDFGLVVDLVVALAFGCTRLVRKLQSQTVQSF